MADDIVYSDAFGRLRQRLVTPRTDDYRLFVLEVFVKDAWFAIAHGSHNELDHLSAMLGNLIYELAIDQMEDHKLITGGVISEQPLVQIYVGKELRLCRLLHYDKGRGLHTVVDQKRGTFHRVKRYHAIAQRTDDSGQPVPTENPGPS